MISTPSPRLAEIYHPPAWMPRLAFAPTAGAPRGDVLVVVFLRGAADVLNMVVPHGEDAYYRMRPALGIARPDDPRAGQAERCINLDGFFGLHPALAPLLPAWQAGQLAVVHACGAPDESRSHFRAMELMERGVETETGPGSGWIGRHLAALDTGNSSPLRAIGLGSQVQRSLRGSVPVTALQSITDFHLPGSQAAASRMQAALDAVYNGQDALSRSGQETLKILQDLQRLDPAGYQPQAGVLYPADDFGAALRQVAALVKAGLGLEVAAVDLGGWDTHFAQGGAKGQMANLLTSLAGGLAAFYEDLSAEMAGISVVVMSEFGRRAYENGSLGTDHGHGSLMLALGGSVNGGRVHGEWPGLETEQLTGPGDLAVTTDYRDVLAEVCVKRLNNPDIAAIFPGYQPSPRNIFRNGL